jgi:hypothetical protein
MENEIKRLQQAKRALEMNLAASNTDEVRSLESFNDQLRISLETLKNQKAQLAEEARALEDKMITLNRENEMLTTRLNNSSDKINELIAEKQRLESSQQSGSGLVEQKNAEIEGLKDLVTRLQDEVGRRRMEFTDKEAEVNRLRTAITTLMTENNSLKNDVEVLRGNNERLLSQASQQRTAPVVQPVVRTPSVTSREVEQRLPAREIVSIPQPVRTPVAQETAQRLPSRTAPVVEAKPLLKNAKIVINAQVLGDRGVVVPVHYKEFFVLPKSLESLLKESNIQAPQGRDVDSLSELWAKSLKNGFSYPGVAAKIRAVLSEQSVARGRTNSRGEVELDSIAPGIYFIVGATSSGLEGTVWSQQINVKPGSNAVSLSSDNASWAR